MNQEDFVAHCKERLEHHTHVCSLLGRAPQDNESCMILLWPKRTAPTIGTRGVCVGSRFVEGAPMWFYSYTVAQTKKLIKKYDTPVPPTNGDTNEQEEGRSQGSRAEGTNGRC